MILADTGFFFALHDRSDRHHASAVRALKAVREALVTTVPVVTETTYLLQVRCGQDAAIRFVSLLADGFAEVAPIDQKALRRLHALIEKYRDLPMDFADASLVWLAEERGEGRILSTDQRDFGAYRFKNRKPFKNLLKL